MTGCSNFAARVRARSDASQRLLARFDRGNNDTQPRANIPVQTQTFVVAVSVNVVCRIKYFPNFFLPGHLGPGGVAMTNRKRRPLRKSYSSIAVGGRDSASLHRLQEFFRRHAEVSSWRCVGGLAADVKCGQHLSGKGLNRHQRYFFLLVVKETGGKIPVVASVLCVCLCVRALCIYAHCRMTKPVALVCLCAVPLACGFANSDLYSTSTHFFYLSASLYMLQSEAGEGHA